MEQTGEWPLAIIATQDVACGARLWSVGGKRRATVIVKATFSLVRGGAAQLAAPRQILLGDQHHESSLERSVIASADMAPYLPRAEVVLSAHACAPSPSPFLAVRLAVMGSRPLVDKTLHVFGERMWLEGEQMTAPVPFTRIPIRYERAHRGQPGYEENPVGMPVAAGQPVANVIDPADPLGPAGFGPMAGFWPARRRLLRDLDPTAIEAPAPAIPDPFAWSYFHAAPPDQRCSFFEGNEWILIEGMHPDIPRLESQLPGARAQARLYGVDATGHRDIGLSADTLWLDADRLVACLVWRGNFEVEGDAALEAAQVFAGVELPGRPIPWPGGTAQVTALVEERKAASAPGHAQPAPAAIEAPSSETPTASPRQVDALLAYAASAPSNLGAAEPSEPPPSEPAPVTNPQPMPARWAPGSTLASPGMMLPEQLQNLGAGPEPVVEDKPIDTSPRLPESVTNVHADVAVAEASPVTPDPAGGDPNLAAGLNNTMKQPPSELRRLIAKATEEEAAAAVAAARPPMVSFDDSPTFIPDSEDVRKIVEEAERQIERDERADPVGVRPSPTTSMRSSKTTIRGLGEGGDSKPPPEPAPPTARFDDETRSLLQGQEQPTAQLAVPDQLLALTSGPASAAAARHEPAPPPEPAIQHIDEDDTGRPTLTNVEAPAFSQVAPKPLPVHMGETRNEVERRIRERESLAGVDLSDVDLSGFDLSGQTLTGCRFDRANLRGARLRGVDLSGASFEGADASKADFDDAILERTNFVGAKLAESSIRRAFLTDANMTTADLTAAQLDQSSGLRAMFCRARLDRASLQGVTLDGADFTEAQLDGANLDGALLPELRAYEVSAEGARFCRCSLRGARFDGAVLGRARFEGAHADDSIWDRSVLDGATLEGARLVGASFTKASLREASLSGADLSEARFNRAVLTGAKLVGTDLNTVTLDGAELTGIVTDA